MKGRITIRADRCKACLLCIEVCQREAIVRGVNLSPSGYAPVVAVEDAGCTGCALCAIRCPEAAIEVERDDE
jgi:2-oxoglutarate ferredoxin oxidoreductase subunit delta